MLCAGLLVCSALACVQASILRTLRPLEDEIRELQMGVTLDLGPRLGRVFVIGGVGDHFGLPSGQLAGRQSRADRPLPLPRLRSQVLRFSLGAA
jgi:hypothetical protein